MKHVIKRKGKIETFDERKLYASIYAALIALRITDEQAETISDLVSHSVIKDILHRHEISSGELHKIVVEHLKKYNPEAAFIYETHRDIS